MLIGSNKKGLIDKTESCKADVTESDFVVVIGTHSSMKIKK